MRSSLAVDAKGKAQPIAVWQAQRALARVSVERVGGAPLVGRGQEITLLRETLTRVIREREPQLVTLVGVPGIGKSRLVYELFQTIETGDHGLVYWRHGRSLPYGDGVTFWALGEMVKAQAGILESDSREQAGEKLREAVERLIDDAADVGWIERHRARSPGSRPTIRGQETGATSRLPPGAACSRRLPTSDRSFSSSRTCTGPTTCFSASSTTWSSGRAASRCWCSRPLVPSSSSRRPDWGGGKVNSSTILLSPLTVEETARLLHALLGRSALDADLQTRLLEHAGGNPLYAEEFTRMLVSRPDEVVLPETVQGVISARLDTCRPRRRRCSRTRP